MPPLPLKADLSKLQNVLLPSPVPENHIATVSKPRVQLHVLYGTCGIVGSVPNAVHASEQSVFCSRLEESQC